MALPPPPSPGTFQWLLLALPWLAAPPMAACDARPTSPPVLPILESTTAEAVRLRGDDPTTVAPDAVTTPALGARNPLVVVTLFTDYQCPNCRRMHDLAARLLDRWQDVVQLQFRQLPLSMHPLARLAAVVALAAHRQGRFACMNAALSRSRPSWTGLAVGTFAAFAKERLAPTCQLDQPRFARDLGDAALAEKVQADWELAGDLALRGTPTVLVDGLEATLWPRAGVRPALLLNALVRRSLREAALQVEACKRSPDCDPLDLPAERLFGNTGDVDEVTRLLD